MLAASPQLILMSGVRHRTSAGYRKHLTIKGEAGAIIHTITAGICTKIVAAIAQERHKPTLTQVFVVVAHVCGAIYGYLRWNT